MLSLGKFRVGDRVVYPSHGVGEIIGEETQSIGGLELRVFIISLIKENMLLRVPVKRATSAGLRLLSSLDIMHGIFSILQS
jgi:CarD family transcriptional regulator